MAPNTGESPLPASAVPNPAPPSLAVWHARFVQQAGWTRELRRELFARAGLSGARRVLEVGCGTGAVSHEVAAATRGRVVGVDASATSLAFARQADPATAFVCGAAESLPYTAGTFDLCYCHFLLLWLPDPLAAVTEMCRVTRRGGSLLALAEPDYGGRIDYPSELAPLGYWQRQALERQGADTAMGRKLGALLVEAGLRKVETGVLGGKWGTPPTTADLSAEWTVLEADLHGTASPAVLEELRVRDAAAWRRGERILFVPTFYASGQV